MTKAELRAEYVRWRERFTAGEVATNEWALHLDEALAGYFGLPPTPLGEYE